MSNKSAFAPGRGAGGLRRGLGPSSLPLLYCSVGRLCHWSCDVFPNDPKMFFSPLYCLSWGRLGVKDKPGLEPGWTQVWLITSHSCKESVHLPTCQSTSAPSFSTPPAKSCFPLPCLPLRKHLQWTTNSTSAITALFKPTLCPHKARADWCVRPCWLPLPRSGLLLGGNTSFTPSSATSLHRNFS